MPQPSSQARDLAPHYLTPLQCYIQSELNVCAMVFTADEAITSALSSPYPTYRQATLDPWSVPRFGSNGGGSDFAAPRSATMINGGAASSLAGLGLPGEWWKMQETVDVTIQGQQGSS
ncbi:hypothetical protein C8R48DRAFT_772083 [Suillus tomentosus]|nr:hypothetical protein C8R48DRAFT_772083 [Suillus tomentosus]